MMLFFPLLLRAENAAKMEEERKAAKAADEDMLKSDRVQASVVKR